AERGLAQLAVGAGAPPDLAGGDEHAVDVLEPDAVDVLARDEPGSADDPALDREVAVVEPGLTREGVVEASAGVEQAGRARQVAVPVVVLDQLVGGVDGRGRAVRRPGELPLRERAV